MVKNGRTWRQDMSMLKRGMVEFDKILPNQIFWILMYATLAALLPFATTAVSAFLIDGLLKNYAVNTLLLSCFLGIGLIFLLSVCRNFLECKIAVRYSRLFSSHELILTNKSYDISYRELEKDSTRQLRDEISGSIHLSGAGMASLYWDLDSIFRCFAVLVFAVLIGGFIFTKILLWDRAVNHTYCHGIFLFFMIIAFLVLFSYLSCKMTSKRFDVSFEIFQNGAKYSRYGDFYTMEYLIDEDSAMDARIYQQESLIIRESCTKCYDRFAEGKREEMNAVSYFDGIKLLSSCICGCAVYLLIGNQALLGAIGCGSILMMYAAVTMFIDSLSGIAETITDLRNNNEHLSRFFEYMDLPCEDKNENLEWDDKRESDESKEREELSIRDIVFENVSFRYSKNHSWVLYHINLSIKAGERLAIVGENGSGKTTLIKLLCRLYKPTQGRILLNGRDIWEYNYSIYIHSIAAVFQDFSLFAFSLAENIAASDLYDESKVNAVIAQVGLSQKIDRLERGIRQPLFHDFDEEGVNLSGGEAQKVAIARAVYKDADIMILDEPTAALDPYAEYEIYKKFNEITFDKTVFSISHRLSSCKMCDSIIVMCNGKLIQRGTHEELLMDKGNKYYEMWEAQAQYYQI